jgi:hypothetical protein
MMVEIEIWKLVSQTASIRALDKKLWAINFTYIQYAYKELLDSAFVCEGNG